MTIPEKKRTRGERTSRRVPITPLLRGVLADWLAAHPVVPIASAVSGSVSSIDIGGPAVSDGNVISGNLGNGISIYSGIFDTTIRNDYIGLTGDGLGQAGNGIRPAGNGLGQTVSDGIFLDAGCIGTIVGGAVTECNYISNNTGYGIDVKATNTTVTNNVVGLDTGGFAAANGKGWLFVDPAALGTFVQNGNPH